MNPGTSGLPAAPPPRIGYWIFNYEPKWEAASKEVEILSETFRDAIGTRTISLDLWGERWQWRGRNKHLPLPWVLPALPLILRAADGVEINHIFASPGERFVLPRLARREGTVLTITKQNPTLRGLERNIGALRALRCVVVESERYRDLLVQAGIAPDRIRLIHPGVEPAPYRPAAGPFTIMFATSPRKHDLLVRGILLMVRAAERLPEVRFRLLWRRNPEEAQALLRRLDLPNVELVAGFVEDMGAMYDTAHAVILPALSDNSLKPCPHSGLESLAHGKPLLVSDRTSISGIIGKEGCGVVFEPTIDSLCEAIATLREHYDAYQVRAHSTVERMFSMSVFIERYRELYVSLLERDAISLARRSERRRT